MKLNKIYIAVVIVIVFELVMLVWQNIKSKDNTVAEIVSDGRGVKTIDLSNIDEAYEFEVRNELGYNKIRAEKGRIAVIEADCPDKVCVNQGYIAGGDLPIVCLPHKLIITMGNGNVDAVTGK